MTNVENILNDDEFFGYNVDTPKEGTEQHKTRECLRSVIGKGKEHLLGHKWTHERVDKASDETINKTYAEYQQRELNKKGEKTGKALENMLLIYILLAFLDSLRSRMLKNYARILKMIQSLKIKWLA